MILQGILEPGEYTYQAGLTDKNAEFTFPNVKPNLLGSKFFNWINKDYNYNFPHLWLLYIKQSEFIKWI